MGGKKTFGIQDLFRKDFIFLNTCYLIVFFRSWYSSVSERNFTVDFLNFMEFCENTIYHSDFNSSKSFLLGFPHKLLEDGENIASNKNFRTREKAFLTLVKFMPYLNKVTGMILKYDQNLNESKPHEI